MCALISALIYALFSLFDCWETHSYTDFEGGELPAEREHTSGFNSSKEWQETPRLIQNFRIWGRTCNLLSFYDKDRGK